MAKTLCFSVPMWKQVNQIDNEVGDAEYTEHRVQDVDYRFKSQKTERKAHCGSTNGR